MPGLFGNPYTPGVVFVSVWNCRAAVSRYAKVKGGVSTEAAQNWQDLEDAAIEAVEAQGGAVNMSAHYDCPAELAERAIWGSDNEKGN